MIYSKTKDSVRRGWVAANAVLILLFGLLHGSAHAQLIGTIAIGDIEYNNPKQSTRSADSVTNALAVDLNKGLLRTRKFTLLDYTELTARLDSQGLNLDGFYNKTYTSTELLQLLRM